MDKKTAASQRTALHEAGSYNVRQDESLHGLKCVRRCSRIESILNMKTKVSAAIITKPSVAFCVKLSRWD